MFWNPNGCSVVGVASGSWWMRLRGEEREREKPAMWGGRVLTAVEERAEEQRIPLCSQYDQLGRLRDSSQL